MRLVGYTEDEPSNKLNALIANVHRIWVETADEKYRTNDGRVMPVRGAAQMVFSDLGTPSVEETRGFSAYRWIRERLIGLGVPASQIAFMQHHKTSVQKQKLIDQVVSGAVRIVIGSSETMGTGINAQLRMKALHHLDVPWLPSQIGQREGRIERQGNQHDEVLICAYATLGSLDASMWQTNERKARFIAAVLSGDRTIRKLEDLESSQSNQFAMAKAIASGDARLMHKAGLEADIARLRRQAEAHYDDQWNVRYQISAARETIALCEQRIPHVEADMQRFQRHIGSAFQMTVLDQTHTETRPAGAALIAHMRRMDARRETGSHVAGSFCGFDLSVTGTASRFTLGDDDDAGHRIDLVIERSSEGPEFALQTNTGAEGLVTRMTSKIEDMLGELPRYRARLEDAQARLADYLPRQSGDFPLPGRPRSQGG